MKQSTKETLLTTIFTVEASECDSHEYTSLSEV